jgi:hypothetical protein
MPPPSEPRKALKKNYKSGSKYKAGGFKFMAVKFNKAYFMADFIEDDKGLYPSMAVMEDNGTPGKDKDKFYINLQTKDECLLFDHVTDCSNIVIYK